MRQPAAAPLDHFCILFLREKDVPARHERRASHLPLGGITGGQCPLPNRAVASFETKSWATRTVSQIKFEARLALR